MTLNIQLCQHVNMFWTYQSSKVDLKLCIFCEDMRKKCFISQSLLVYLKTDILVLAVLGVGNGGWLTVQILQAWQYQ